MVCSARSPRCPTRLRAPLDSINVSTHAGLRDRTLIGLMVYSFARIGAALGIAVEDVYARHRIELIPNPAD
jgi:integrase